MRNATEWREFWRDRGERELAAVLGAAWPPARDRDATRIATLLGSRAPAEALTHELGRMRQGRAPANDAEDAAAADRIVAWFEAA